jgi:hypothetical protein
VLTTFPPRASLLPLKRRLISFTVLFAAQNCVKNLKNASYACSSITSQAGTSSPRASRSRECPSPFADSFLYAFALHCRYNPVLGEFFRCRYDYPNGTQGFFIAEQGSYHYMPPVHWNVPFLLLMALFLLKSRTIHLYPPSITFHRRTRLLSSASFDQSPNFSATPSQQLWRVRAVSRLWAAQRTLVNQSRTPLPPLPPSPPPHEAKDAC